jgi:hypothetical protein
VTEDRVASRRILSMVGPRRVIVNTNVEKRTMIMFNERLIINRPKSPNYNQSPSSEYISLATSFALIYLSISYHVALNSTIFALIIYDLEPRKMRILSQNALFQS